MNRNQMIQILTAPHASHPTNNAFLCGPECDPENYDDLTDAQISALIDDLTKYRAYLAETGHPDPNDPSDTGNWDCAVCGNRMLDHALNPAIGDACFRLLTPAT